MNLLKKYLWNKSFLSPKEDGFSRIILHNMLFKLHILKVKLVLNLHSRREKKSLA